MTLAGTITIRIQREALFRVIEWLTLDFAPLRTILTDEKDREADIVYAKALGAKLHAQATRRGRKLDENGRIAVVVSREDAGWIVRNAPPRSVGGLVGVLGSFANGAQRALRGRGRPRLSSREVRKRVAGAHTTEERHRKRLKAVMRSADRANVDYLLLIRDLRLRWGSKIS